MEKTYAVINHDMKANELRIGNYVRYCDNYYQVQQIIKRNGKYALIFEYLYHGVWIDEVEKIELTLGILDKCKFDNCSRHYNYDIGEIDAYVKKSGNNVCLSLGIFGHGFGDDIEYLHELQNFYFENTKQELEVQL